MIYFDSGIIIRMVEAVDRIRLPIEARWQAIPDGERVGITSRLSRLECRCKPLREKQTDLLASYDTFFASEDVTLKEIDAAVIEKATNLRAACGLKTADAIHAATAMLFGASAFWTTNEGYWRCPGLVVQLFEAI